MTPPTVLRDGELLRNPVDKLEFWDDRQLLRQISVADLRRIADRLDAYDLAPIQYCTNPDCPLLTPHTHAPSITTGGTGQ